ncbi:MAG: carbamoyltransferase HypF [Propionibacteriaceae bacterium]|nr:carbamoyltransferase HypF [Propionibacteriaceae bacterium]
MIRRRGLLRGIVQGVGFRPHVAKVAGRFPVTGWCGNDDEQVFIEAQGTPEAVADFYQAVHDQAPPLARILETSYSPVELVAGEIGFTIVASQRRPGAVTLIPPDLAPCDDCLAEFHDPSDRRHRYPFITCVNCGPRLSIIRDLPYDRPNTTLADFPLCPACRREYEDPADRRFHAQPISCWDCGPRLWLEVADSGGGGEDGATAGEAHTVAVGPGAASDDARPVANQSVGDARRSTAAVITEVRRRLREGQIVAVKGIGGFTLFCDARQEAAVARLRRRKHRPGKPFAVMAASLAAAEAVAGFSGRQQDALTSPERPIVLAPRSPGYDLAASVAPGLADVGVMLPSAPLHHLLLDQGEVYVATSGNLAGEPLAYDNADARQRLGRIVDAFLMHDRGIQVPVEDSVLRAAEDQVWPVRRSRGYAPLPVRLGQADVVVLAVGGELKNTFALTRDGWAFLSAHIGDMGSLESQRAFDRSVAQLTSTHRRRPDLVVADLHPDYATTAWAERYRDRCGVPLLQVQHHQAHALSLAVEHGLVERGRIEGGLTVVAFDGTGYGPDATIWGGEIIALGSDPLNYQRLWHLPRFPLPGGDAAVAHPWRSAAGLLAGLGLDQSGVAGSALGAAGSPLSVPSPGATTGDPLGATGGPPGAPGGPPGIASGGQPGIAPGSSPGATLSSAFPGLPPGVSGVEWELCQWQLANSVATVPTTSAGRLFDAVASLLGLCHHATYEAQAAMELEVAAERCGHHDHADPPPADVAGLIRELVREAAAGRPAACLARRFHDGLAQVVASAAMACDQGSGLIGWTGGVAVNRVFTAALAARLSDLGGKLLTHRRVPSNDGGLSLGQALAGYLTLTRGG